MILSAISWSWLGFSFTTDEQNYYLDSILAPLKIAPIGAHSLLEGKLYLSDANGLPLTLLPGATFSHTDLTVGTHSTFFTPTSSVELLANTTYTFVIANQRTAILAEWLATSADTSPHNTVPGSSWSISPLLAFSEDSGATWTDGGAGHLVPMAGVYAIPTLAVPEPTSLVLLGVAGAVGLLLRRRRKSEPGR